MKAAQHLGYSIDTICHHKGRCGECKVWAIPFESHDGPQLPEILEAVPMVLACQTRVDGNLLVIIPDDS